MAYRWNTLRDISPSGYSYCLDRMVDSSDCTSDYAIHLELALGACYYLAFNLGMHGFFFIIVNELSFYSTRPGKIRGFSFLLISLTKFH